VYNDAYTDYASLIEHIGDFDNIVISPGPGSPDNKADFGICSELILEAKVPILGICLGHQGICSTFGGEVTRAKEPMHGRLSRISHSSGGIFASIPQNFEVVRYHSLIAESVHLPMCLRSTAWTHDGTIMGLEHNTKPIYGIIILNVPY
jgi:anthranilate synthase/aminodeoxychorismate synthase-like glutamine amidotransferase